MGDEPEAEEDQDQDKCSGQKFTVYRAKPGDVLMAKRTFFFHGNENIVVRDIEEVAISSNCIRMVTKEGHVHIVHNAHLLAETILPAKGQSPFLFNPSKSEEGT